MSAIAYVFCVRALDAADVLLALVGGAPHPHGYT
jgi:hypothetical protein